VITIYKYELKVTDNQVVEIHDEHKILNAQLQDGRICMWVGVDTDTKKVPVNVKLVGTGNPIDQKELEGYDYLATVQEGFFVWHVFVPESSK
jgi:hypothetical protein